MVVARLESGSRYKQSALWSDIPEPAQMVAVEPELALVQLPRIHMSVGGRADVQELFVASHEGTREGCAGFAKEAQNRISATKTANYFIVFSLAADTQQPR